jgi:pimeloyl-ACP methyl ester carboxylesterase
MRLVVHRLRRVLLCAGIAVVALGACSTRPSPPPSRTNAVSTRSLDIDGVPIRVRVAGLAERRAGEPIVVFESGGALPLETWDPIFADVATFAAAIAYDRAGTGESGWDGQPPTPARVGARLERVLAELDAQPPYVLVGHSWGGALVRYFAGTHPEEVAGVLYLDPTDITLTRADLVALFKSFGATAADYDALDRTMKQALASAPAPLRAEAEVVGALLDSDLASRAIPPAPRVPTTVLVAGRVTAPPQRLIPFDARAYAEAMQASRVERLRAWASGDGSFHIADSAGHMIHMDDPELVVDAIRRLVERTSRSRRSAWVGS